MGRAGRRVSPARCVRKAAHGAGISSRPGAQPQDDGTRPCPAASSPRAICFRELNPRALGNAGCFSAAPRPEHVAQTVSAFVVYTQHRFRLTPEPVAAPAWFQLARQEQAVQGLPWASVVLLGRFRIVSSIVGASTHMPQLHVHLPGEDGLRRILSPAATARVVTGGRGDWRLAWEMDGGIAFPQLVISPRSGRA